ncbi:EF-P lysine aminoacylase EpmA [Bythopirellula polymerisocia]|uniref:Elongation factor P--(R)-beta-lysine ligase n=1 Tax=Bythopirellula polymerisocia TaxID=2528003 RepID=A0A5C6D3M7_9BACT|nr:EF-P lysine aminoacylase EpmA [Bythopirellula polymerisocia]TWU30381.1 Elongation factor P--(R)-beta-lysine ligase [Bythopirellula polymerisocia]
MFNRIQNLQRRSELLNRLRSFFYDRNFIEVETPLLSSEVIPELHIEPIAVSSDATRRTAFLQASPELHMKRLLAEGMPAIFQVTRSFRADELGRLHNPEFTLVEWYREGDDMQAGMNLLDELCQTLLGTPPARRIRYGEAFQELLEICPHTATCEQLATCAKRNAIAIPENMPTTDRNEWLNLLLTARIEPQLGLTAPDLLYDYPASQSALAKLAIRDDGIEVAERFELYWKGVELANGYHELTDAAELRERLTVVNQQRELAGRHALPMPESLLAAMQLGLPNSSGCALGFDRLAVLAIGAEKIGEVMAFSEENN